MSKKRKRDAWYSDRIENGLPVTRAVLQLFRSFEGKQVEISCRGKRYYTTQPQRGYYWGVVIFLIGERMRADGVTGRWSGPITDQEVHELMSEAFLRRSTCINFETGECLEYTVSTTDLTVAEMSEYIERVMKWAVDQYSTWKSNDDGTSEFVPFEIPEANKQLTFV